jgi:hypothetical protein
MRKRFCRLRSGKNARKFERTLTVALQRSIVGAWVAPSTWGSWSVGWRMSDSAPLYGFIILAVGLVVATTTLVFLIKEIVALV